MSVIAKTACVEKSAQADESELEQINRQSLRTLTADEVFTFKLAACNDQVDRDLERFTQRALEGFAKLFVGKPVLRDHNWSANAQTARVYAAGVDERDGARVLTLRAYMPRNEATKATIDLIETGMLRECSVGVAVERSLCSVCGSEYGKCQHRRGGEYEGKRCHVELDGAADCYEISLCAVPAQPGAGVCKRYEAVEAGKPPAPDATPQSSQGGDSSPYRGATGAGAPDHQAKQLEQARARVSLLDRIVKI